MQTRLPATGEPAAAATVATIARDAALLSGRIASLRERLYAPGERKTLRRFTGAEAAAMLGVGDGDLRRLASVAGPGAGRESRARSYRLDEINALRKVLAQTGGARIAQPHRPEGAPAQVVAVANFKGGSGKTTTTVHLAQHLAMRGFAVLAVDLDPQASLSTLFGYQPETDLAPGDTLFGVIRYEAPRPIEEVIRPTYFPGVDLVPGNLELHEFEHETPRALLQAGARPAPFYARIASALEPVAKSYDVVLVDCPPQLGFLTLGALCAATGVLLTVHPQMLDVASMSQFLIMTADLMDVVARAGADVKFDFFRYVLTRYEPNDGPQAQVASFLRSLFGDRVLENAVLKSTALADAGLTKQTLYEVGREGMTRSTFERARESLDAVNGEIEALIQSVWERPAGRAKSAA